MLIINQITLRGYDMDKREDVYKISLDITMTVIKESPTVDEIREDNKNISNEFKDEFLSKQENFALTIPELKKLLRIGTSKAYELVNSGEIKSIKIGRKTIIPWQSIIDYLGQ